MNFEVIHNLDELNEDQLRIYLSQVSAKIGLDPTLNALDTIWLPNPTGQGRSLVVYARRGTCEILRNIYEVEVESLTYALVEGSMVFTATGRSKKRGNRQEIAIGSKNIKGLTGRELDSAIMTASTRALNRLTMQFTELGILAESEVVDMVGDVPNPAGSVQLAANPMPPMYAAPTAPANNAPGTLIGPSDDAKTQAQVAAVIAIREAEKAAKEADNKAAEKAAEPLPATMVSFEESRASEPEKAAEKADIPADTEAAKKAAKPRRRKVVALDDVEPETVSANGDKTQKSASADTVPPQVNPAAPPQVFDAGGPPNVAPPQANPAVPTQANPASFGLPETGIPSKEQMEGFKAALLPYTQQLTPSENMPAPIKMRAFITRLNDGVPPQSLTTAKWESTIAWFQKFEGTNGIKGLVKYINDSLGVG